MFRFGLLGPWLLRFFLSFEALISAVVLYRLRFDLGHVYVLRAALFPALVVVVVVLSSAVEKVAAGGKHCGATALALSLAFALFVRTKFDVGLERISTSILVEFNVVFASFFINIVIIDVLCTRFSI